MSDYEEPAAKVSKMEMSSRQHVDELDEGQEEWLSEGILTDDDYNPNADNDVSNINQEDTTPSLPDETDDTQHITDTQAQVPTKSDNTEKTLDNFQNRNQTEFPGELGAFLIRKTDSKVVDLKREESEIDESIKHSDDDGHDTDELLRMLGEDTKKDLKKTEQKTNQELETSDDDDEYIFDGTKVARLKVAKNAIMKKYPSKAVPEDMSDAESDESSDEGQTVKRMFGMKRASNVAAKSTARSGTINAVKTITKKVVSLNKNNEKSPVTSTPISKPQTVKVQRREPEELIHEEFLDEDQSDLDEDVQSEASLRLMRPERMDEEPPSDGDSRSDSDSLYDELPTSDSDDQNEWFTLDVRAERAGDYIPLLGSKAHQLLLAEKQRVSTRLSTLKQSVEALNDSSSQQAEMLRRATLQLAELDAALKA